MSVESAVDRVRLQLLIDTNLDLEEKTETETTDAELAPPLQISIVMFLVKKAPPQAVSPPIHLRTRLRSLTKSVSLTLENGGE